MARRLVMGFADRARLCRNEEIVLVGGGNSAGQAAVLRNFAKHIWTLVRGAGLQQTMSRYLIDGIASIDNVEVLTHTEVVALYGSREGQLERVRWRNNLTGEETERPIRHVFLLIGADPAIAWLKGSRIALDSKTFQPDGIGRSLQRRPVERRVRPSIATNTSVRGVFAAGTYGPGQGAAIGESAIVVGAELHTALANGQTAMVRELRTGRSQRVSETESSLAQPSLR